MMGFSSDLIQNDVTLGATSAETTPMFNWLSE